MPYDQRFFSIGNLGGQDEQRRKVRKNLEKENCNWKPFQEKKNIFWLEKKKTEKKEMKNIFFAEKRGGKYLDKKSIFFCEGVQKEGP